jgi:hypothetical protein
VEYTNYFVLYTVYIDSNAQFLFNFPREFSSVSVTEIIKHYVLRSIIMTIDYFNRIFMYCFLILGAGCGTAWTFERHINRELRGFTNAHFIIGSKTECEDRCLDERSFVCR